MAITQKLQTRLSQKLVLTPSLQQAIKLLPMTTLELAELLTQEIVENPMLEEVPTEEMQAVDPQAQTSEPEAPEAPKPDRPDANWDEQDYAYFFGEYLDDGGYRSRNCRRSRTRSRPRRPWPTICFGKSRCGPTSHRCSARSAKPSSAT